MRYAALILILLLCPLALGLEWSEVLFNPDGIDDKKEFVELLGEENLTGCTVTDSRSSDTLELLQAGGNIILIVETDSPLNSTESATIYGAGKAIGNGLGNSYDEISIACNGTALLETSYTAEEIDGYTPGSSILYDGGWIPGTLNGTPGTIPESKPPVVPPEDEKEPGTGSSGGDSGKGRMCNESLAITLGKISGHVGEIVHFTVVTDGYAEWEAAAADEVFAYGDTLTRKEHSLELPNRTVRLTAKSRNCDSRQRAVRIITVIPTDKDGRPEETHHEDIQKTPEKDTERNTTLEKNAAVQDMKALDSGKNGTTGVAPPSEKILPVTGAVILDTDTNVIPWISLFGCVVLIVSGWLFWHISRQENVPL